MENVDNKSLVRAVIILAVVVIGLGTILSYAGKVRGAGGVDSARDAQERTVAEPGAVSGRSSGGSSSDDANDDGPSGFDSARDIQERALGGSRHDGADDVQRRLSGGEVSDLLEQFRVRVNSSGPGNARDILEQLRAKGHFTHKFVEHLRSGSSGDDVIELQERLRAEGHFEFHTSTGHFGPITLEAVKKFQAAHGIVNTGFVGPLTVAELNK